MNRYRELIAQRLVSLARKRARARGVPFDLQSTDVVVPERCPVLGVALKLEAGPFSDNSATLDRIVPELGYVRGNVAVISSRANTLKSNASLAELAALHGYVAANLNSVAVKPREPIASESLVQAHKARSCAECAAVLSPKRSPCEATVLCRSCAMRKAWASEEYQASIMAARAKRRKRCRVCDEPGLGEGANYHPECWAKHAQSLR
jgi:hypothetical protein